jgi:hypothetical protein
MGMYPQFIPKTMKSRPSTWRREPLSSVTISTWGWTPAVGAAAAATESIVSIRDPIRTIRPIR